MAEREVGLRVVEVDEDSSAGAAGLLPGDLVSAVNGTPVYDVLDFDFHAASIDPVLDLRRDGVALQVTLEKDEDDLHGLRFASELGDKIRTCTNKCVFCFIHQMPRKMRKTLYVMDDDFRLSFLHGNYVTLTNLADAEWRRILEQRLSPLYVSVHATDPGLRGVLLGKKDPAPIIPQLRELATNRIDVHAQVVLCPGWNDSWALADTIEELSRLHPAATGLRAGVQSVAIVPVGLTQFRERLPDLRAVDRDYARQMIATTRPVGSQFRERLGTRFVWLSDEWYFLAGARIPGRAHYEGFPQLEDGVGTVRRFMDDAARLARRLPAAAPAPVKATLVTGELAAEMVRGFAARLSQIRRVDVNVCVVRNRFFGEHINVTGLLTGADIVEQLGEFGARPTVYLPDICLRDGEDVTLDDMTVEDLRRATGLDVRVCGTRPRDLARLMGLVG